jgi:hypothetical protein
MVVRCVVPRVNVDARCADAVAGAARKRDMTSRGFRSSVVQSSWMRGRAGGRRRVRKVPSACDRDACVTLFDFSHCLHIQTFGFEDARFLSYSPSQTNARVG